VLAIPATSVPCERAASIAGNIVSARRARLSPQLIENLAFGSMNWNFLSEFDLDELRENLEISTNDEEEHQENNVDECVRLDEDLPSDED
jgi:hypothetical protein